MQRRRLRVQRTLNIKKTWVAGINQVYKETAESGEGRGMRRRKEVQQNKQQESTRDMQTDNNVAENGT